MLKRALQSISFVAVIISGVSCKSWGKFWTIYSAGEAKPLYAGAPLWNDYIAADGTALTVRGVSANAPSGVSSRFNASGAACNATTGGYGACIHAGMMRQSVINDKEDCTGISASDALGVFIWVCDASTKPVRLIAVGFNEGKYMTDLIDFNASAFRSNSVRVVIDGAEYNGPASVWWANSVQNLPGQSYGSASGIYLVQSDLASGTALTPQADKTTLLMKPGVKFTYSGGINALNNSGRNYSWFEGTLDMTGSTGSANSLVITNGSFVVVENFGIIFSSATGGSAYKIDGKNCYYRDIRYANATIAGEKSIDFVTGGDYNLLSGVNTSNDMTPLTLNSANNIILHMTNSHHGGGAAALDIQASGTNNVFLNMTMANIGSGGTGAIRYNASAAGNTWLNLAMGSSPTPAIHFFTYTNLVSQFVNFAAYTTANNVINTAANTYAYFGGGVSFGTSAAPTCGASALSGLNNSCGVQNASDFSALSLSLDPTNSFVGKVTTDDPLNASDGGASPTSYASITDWLRFSNLFRGYGLDGGAFPSAANHGRCTGANCRIWDWSLRATDTLYRNVLAVPAGNMSAAHKWSAGTQIQCTQPGAQWLGSGTCDRPPFPGNSTTCAAAGGSLSVAGCFTTFLRNAYEIIGDNIGNENGLCESNEACIYTPNIASYQGHGNLTCIRGPAEYGCASAFIDGTISGVILFQYGTNGY